VMKIFGHVSGIYEDHPNIDQNSDREDGKSEKFDFARQHR